MLLLDLDGVVVLELTHPHVQRLEIVLLHDLQEEALRGLELPVVILTHRSRAEARRILEAAGLTGDVVVGVVAAEDLLQAALLSGRPFALLRHGLRKSWILPVLEKRYGVARENIAFIDDRLDNLTDLLSNGIGLALHAPSGTSRDGSSITSFNFQQAASILRSWNSERSVTGLQKLEPREIHTALWTRTGLNTRRQARSTFNVVRLLARTLRRVGYLR